MDNSEIQATNHRVNRNRAIIATFILLAISAANYRVDMMFMAILALGVGSLTTIFAYYDHLAYKYHSEGAE